MYDKFSVARLSPFSQSHYVRKYKLEDFEIKGLYKLSDIIH